MRNIALLGSTGSIGRNTLEVIAQNKDKFKLISIAAGESMELLEKQVHEFSPEIVSVKNKEDAEELRQKFPGAKIYYGDDGLQEAVCHETVDTMVSAIDGTTALAATLQSIKNNQRICLANKETLVAAGELINRELEGSNAELIPIDSEQSAIFQAIGNNGKSFIKRVILTASGGPFFKRVTSTPGNNNDPFAGITIKDALAHPTWNMGTKITIDSATLMNKALEIVETFYLFKLKKDQIDVIIHPQSIIHSMVEFIDSSIIAQLSHPDMRLPILYSLSYPQRIHFEARHLDFSQLQKMEFFKVDTDTFKSIRMAYDVLTEGKNSGAVLNAANETAVEFFLKEKISFKDIFAIVGEIFYNENFHSADSIEDINETIENTKAKTTDYIKRVSSG
ncbi:MAG: 1-deoxy-D-xylulose-5-phosphate reductoisomerase [bacterium]|nr:1-deoxy-D-xylulose-5-phosphate reductoisomerase [bacterium]